MATWMIRLATGLLLTALAAGCAAPGWRPWLAEDAAKPPPESASNELAKSDTSSATTLSSPVEEISLTPLLVQVPTAHRDRTSPMWNYLREDFLDSATARRLRENGLRAGRGELRDWPAIKANLDAIEGVLANPQAPLALRHAWPLALELDTRERDQTLFVVKSDGVLSGNSWPASRNVLRLTSLVHPESARKMRLELVPEVRQRGGGWRFVRTEAGVFQQEQYCACAFGAAGFVCDLEPGQFLLVAPGEKSSTYGIVGGAFMTTEINGEKYDYLIFLRVDLNDDRSI